MRKVDRKDPFHSLQLHDDAVFDEQIKLERAINRVSLVLKRDAPFTLDAKLLASEFDHHAVPINRLEQTGTKSPVDFNSAADDFLCQLVYVSNRRSHATVTEHKASRS